MRMLVLIFGIRIGIPGSPSFDTVLNKSTESGVEVHAETNSVACRLVNVE